MEVVSKIPTPTIPSTYGGTRPTWTAATAYNDLVAHACGETIEAVVLGYCGFECEGGPPAEKQTIVLTLEEARPYMQTWSFYHGFGSVKCYAITAYTATRVIFAEQHNGSTWLWDVARNPVPHLPDLLGC